VSAIVGQPVREPFRLGARAQDILVLAALVIATLIMLFPIFLVLVTSFKTPIDITSTSLKLFFTPTLENYLALVGLRPSEFQFDLWLHFRNSVIAAAGSTALAVLLGVPAAYAFARVRFRGSQSGMLFLLAMRLLPPIATVIPLFLIMRQVGLLDTVFALILAYTTFNLPFFVWMMYSFFLDLPRELEEAALIDGATRWQAFVKVILPLSRPGLAASAIFCMVLAWNDFLFAVTLTGRNAPTLPLLVSGFVTDMGVAWGIMMAAGSVIVVPVVLFTLFTQRHLVRGMTAGAVKD
jgi:ABC-type glycerol-3-phosphate transport system permease component